MTTQILNVPQRADITSLNKVKNLMTKNSQKHFMEVNSNDSLNKPKSIVSEIIPLVSTLIFLLTGTSNAGNFLILLLFLIRIYIHPQTTDSNDFATN